MGYIHQARKKGLGYLTEMTVDTGHGIITRVDCYPANQRESDIILEHLKGQLCKYQEIGLDGGYDIGAVYRGLELLGLNGYTAIREYQNNAMKNRFCYEEKTDRFVCRQGEYLEFRKLIYKSQRRTITVYIALQKKQCERCPYFPSCATDLGTVRINASAYYSSFYHNSLKVGSNDYLRAGSFGDISTTSFFPAKPLGCYGDGGAVFTDNDEWAALLRSYRVHGKGTDKYDNIRIGMNSRLDTLQAAVLQVKMKAFEEYELEDVNKAAERYTKELEGIVKTPKIRNNSFSSWAQYSILLKDETERDGLQAYLKDRGIPTMVYYPKPMSRQGAFQGMDCIKTDLSVTAGLCKRVLALPMHPYLTMEGQDAVIEGVKAYVPYYI